MTLVIRALQRKGLYWWVGPTDEQYQAGIIAVQSALGGFPGVVKRARTFKLPGGSEIEFKSAKAERSLVGRGLCGLVVDEAALMKEQTWQRELLPSLMDHDGWAILCSTPRGFNWFVDLKEQTLSNPDWKHFSYPTWANPNISRTRCEEKIIEMGETVWRQEHLGEPTASEFSMFPHQWFDNILVSSIPKSFSRATLGIDLSEGKIKSDWQALTMVGHQAGHHYLDCRALRMDIPQLLNVARKMTDQYGCKEVVYDASGGQAMIANQLEELWPRSSGVTLLAVKQCLTKEIRLQRLAYLFNRSQVHVLNNFGGREYVKEARDFPDGKFDDLLDAHEMTWQAMTRTIYQAA